MCTDNEQCDEGNDRVANVLARLHGPGMETALDKFIEHMRLVIPGFAEGIEHDTLLVIFSAGRTEALKYVAEQTDTLVDASNMMTAMVLSDYSEQRGLDIEQINSNLDTVKQQMQQQEAAT